MKLWLALLTLTTAFECVMPVFIIKALIEDMGELFNSILELRKPLKPEIYGGGINIKKLIENQYNAILKNIKRTRAAAEKKFKKKIPQLLKKKFDKAEESVNNLRRALGNKKGNKKGSKNKRKHKSMKEPAKKKPKAGKPKTGKLKTGKPKKKNKGKKNKGKQRKKSGLSRKS